MKEPIRYYMPDSDKLATREAFMMCHPARYPDCELEEGDLIELQEGIFRLNDDLNPMELVEKRED